MRIASDLMDDVVRHAREEQPNECCGVLALRDGRAVSVYRMVNKAASPLRFEIDGLELARLIDKIEDRGDTLGAIYHSHTRSAPYPSQTDVNFAAWWPGCEWLIVGLDGGSEPLARSYLIDGGVIAEVAVEVTDG